MQACTPQASTMKRTLPALRTRNPRSGEEYVVDSWDNTWRSRAPGPHAHGKRSEVGCGWPEDRGVGTAKTVKRPPQQPVQPQYANYWAPLTRNRHILPHPARPQHTNHWALSAKRHQQEHQPQRPTESSGAMQHVNGRTGDCPGPLKETTTRRNVTGGGGGFKLRVRAWEGTRVI